jgi:hypothetical protein
MNEEEYCSIRHKSNKPHTMEGTACQPQGLTLNTNSTLIWYRWAHQMATIFYFDISVVHRFWRSDFYTGVFGIWCVIALKDKSNNQSLLHPKVWVLPTVVLQFKSTFPHFLLATEIPCHHSGKNFLHVQKLFLCQNQSLIFYSHNHIFTLY